MQASVRILDNVIVQVGVSLGPRDDCTIVNLTPEQVKEFAAASAAGAAVIILNADGTVTAMLAAVGGVVPPSAPSPRDLALARLRASAKLNPDIADLLLVLGL